MKYTIECENTYMYCYTLYIKDNNKIYEAIIESAPIKKKTMLIWLGDFNFPENKIDDFKIAIKQYFASKNIDCIFRYEKRIKS